MRMVKKSCFYLYLTAVAVVAFLLTGGTNDFGVNRKAVFGEEQINERRLSVKEYRDKMKAGWIGQIAGVVTGAPTEFKWRDAIVPADKVPQWKPEMINNAFGQDDLYVEMTFLKTLETYGLNCDIRQAGIDFANSEYMLWCANQAGRNNLRSGIAPPDSGHPKFNRCPNDIDYQIEADYSGLIAPGLPNRAIFFGNKFGRLMNYSDGIYGGIFMGGMYAEAFFTTDIQKIIAAGLACIPSESQYAEMVRDMVQWHKENPKDWEYSWKKAQKKYREDPNYQKCSNGGIDVKINGVYVLLGLLYGNGDLQKTIEISLRGGQDSDCNPSSSAGVLFTTIGFSKLPDQYSKKLDNEKIFSYTAYNFPKLLDACEKLARQCILAEGGRIEKDADGEEIFVIPVKKAKPLPLELSWAPGPIANSKFTEKELAQIKFRYERYPLERIQEGLDKLLPGWKISQCGPDMDPEISKENGKLLLKVHPLKRGVPCILTRSVSIPQGKKATLNMSVKSATPGKVDWILIVKADGKEIFKAPVGVGQNTKAWNPISVDLTSYAGKTVKIEILNQPNGWTCEAGYWNKLEIVW